MPFSFPVYELIPPEARLSQQLSPARSGFAWDPFSTNPFWAIYHIVTAFLSNLISFTLHLFLIRPSIVLNTGRTVNSDMGIV